MMHSVGRRRYLSPLARVNVASVMLIAGWLLTWWPPRNVYGNPSTEGLTESCQFPGKRGAVVRLYTGGGGVTESESYSVTIQPWYFPIERQFFDAYAFPRVNTVRCIGDSIVSLRDKDIDQPVGEFPLRRITRDLVFRPVTYDHGRWGGLSSGLYYSYISELFGFGLLIGGSMLIAVALRSMISSRRHDPS